MENEKEATLECGSPFQTQVRQSAEDIVDEMIKKATLGEISSDEEYISAEEEDDEAENIEVLKSMREDTSLEEHKNDKRDPGEKCETSTDKQENDKHKEEEISNDEVGNVEKSEEEEMAEKLKEREKEEDALSEEERMERRDNSQKHKDAGNVAFRNGDYDEAISEYTQGLDICPLRFHKERAIMYANRAACKMKQEAFEDAISDSACAIDLHPQYMKAILRRAELYEKTEKLDEALKDYEAVVKLDSGHNGARFACMRLEEAIKERNEKMKAEMMGKLKDLGNMVLRPFGLSTNNFKLQQDPNTGSYSVQFQQNSPGNGS